MYDEPDAPEARLICYLSEAGQRDAARQGVSTTREVVHILEPSSADAWDDFFALDPLLIYGTEGKPDPYQDPVVAAEIVIGQPFRYAINHKEPEDLIGWVGFDELIPGIKVWFRPSLLVTYGSRDEAEELDRYLTVSDLLAHERQVRENFSRTKAEHDLNAALLSWRRWFKGEGARHTADVARVIKELVDSGNLSYKEMGELNKKALQFLHYLDSLNPDAAADQTLGRFMDQMAEAYWAACDAAQAAENRKAQKAELMEAKAWVQEHGSKRLHRAVEAELLSASLGAYRDERLAYELSDGWQWKPRDLELKDVVNPAEDALDALLVAKQRFPHASLQYEPTTRTAVITAMFLNRSVYARASDVLEAWHAEQEGHSMDAYQ